jgi:hypothetical protein
VTVPSLFSVRVRSADCPPRATQPQAWWQNLLAEITDGPVPVRGNHTNPRVIEPGRSQWPGEKKIHYGLTKLQKTFTKAILIHQEGGIGLTPLDFFSAKDRAVS